jgi:hypothetical protein
MPNPSLGMELSDEVKERIPDFIEVALKGS